MFHNGGFKSILVASNYEKVLEVAAAFKMGTTKDIDQALSKEALSLNDLTLIYLKDAEAAHVDALIA
jgi:hypothetical protein